MVIINDQNLGILSKVENEILSINFIILLYLFRTIIPILKYPFLVIYITFIIYTVFIHKNIIFSKLKKNVSDFFILIIVVFIFLFSALFSDKIYIVVFKDLINIIILLSIFSLITLYISEELTFRKLYANLIKLIVGFAVFISILDLLDLLDLFSFSNYFPQNTFLRNSFADILQTDYNFAVIPIFLGIFIVFFYLINAQSKIKKIGFHLLNVLFSIQILSAGSRRGIIVLTFICFLLSIIVISSFFIKNKDIKKIVPAAFIFLIEVFLILFLSYWFVFHTSYQFKNNALSTFGIKKESIAKSKISSRIYRYVVAFNIKISSFDLHNLVWSIGFDPSDPDSGWGKGKYRKIYPLTGENVKIVPAGSTGYLLDSTSNGVESKPYFYSLCTIGNSYVYSDFNLEASVYCYVSKDYNGDIVSLLAEGTTYGNREFKYDLANKGVWQKLDILVNCYEGEAAVQLISAKKDASDFSLLRGYVIFAFPQYKPSPKHKDLSYTSSTISNLDSFKEIHYPTKEKTIIRKNYENAFYHIRNDSSKYKSLILSNELDDYSSVRHQFFGVPITFLSKINNIVENNDPIRNFVAKFVSEDTVYHGLKTHIVSNTMPAGFTDSRVFRWRFAIDIFNSEYSWSKKIFGGGFNFLNWYGYYFLKDKTKSDWPHNPFLSILLYSGIFGLLIYCFFLYKVFYYYLKYIKEYPLLFIFFLITFFFSFFSGSSPFDPPIMGFFSIFPFFIHSVHEREKKFS